MATAPFRGRRTGRRLTVASRYRLLRVVGEGATGQVWEAHDLRSNQRVAVKVCSSVRTHRAHGLVHEQSVRIRHRHVLAPHGWGAEDDTVLVVSELVRGGSLAQLVTDHGPLPVPFVAQVVEQVADALRAVHAAGIVHRDVAPANVLLMPSPAGTPDVRLADFGLATAAGQPTATPTGTRPEGTRGFIAPEAGGIAQSAQDLWSLGALAVHLTTGNPPSPPPPGQSPEDWLVGLDLSALSELAPLVRALLDPEAGSRPDAATCRDRARQVQTLPQWCPPQGPAVPDRLSPPHWWHPAVPNQWPVREWLVVGLLVTISLAAGAFSAVRLT